MPHRQRKEVSSVAPLVGAWIEIYDSDQKNVGQEMAAQGLGACFCPAMHLRDVRHLLEGPEPILRRLYVPDLDVRNELKLVTNRRMYHPRYLDVFAGILEEEARRALFC